MCNIFSKQSTKKEADINFAFLGLRLCLWFADNLNLK